MSKNRFRVFTEGDALYQDMLTHMDRARTSICMESYIFEPDAVGRRFVDTLSRRARDGITVRLHLDAFGSSALAGSPEAEQLQQAGVQLKWFNPLRWYRPVKFNRRNHRKLLIIDGEVVWLGGFNIHVENSLQVYGTGRWRDTQARIEGPLPADAQVYFDRLWQGRRRWRLGFDQRAESTLISNHNWFQRHRLRSLLSRRFARAAHRIWICTPYFMPDRFIQRQMTRAARRGIDVRLLLPYKSDRPVTQWVARAAYASLMASGIRIYEYEPRVLHAKTLLIDDNWCTIGSANLDYRSLYINFELNLVSIRGDMVAALHENYCEDLHVSRLIEPRQWLQQYRWLQRVYEGVGWLCRRIL